MALWSFVLIRVASALGHAREYSDTRYQHSLNGTARYVRYNASEKDRARNVRYQDKRMADPIRRMLKNTNQRIRHHEILLAEEW
jgi:hypothetical protein